VSGTGPDSSSCTRPYSRARRRAAARPMVSYRKTRTRKCTWHAQKPGKTVRAGSSARMRAGVSAREQTAAGAAAHREGQPAFVETTCRPPSLLEKRLPEVAKHLSGEPGCFGPAAADPNSFGYYNMTARRCQAEARAGGEKTRFANAARRCYDKHGGSAAEAAAKRGSPMIQLTGGDGYIGRAHGSRAVGLRGGRSSGGRLSIPSRTWCPHARIAGRRPSSMSGRPDRAAAERIFAENDIEAVIHFAGFKSVGGVRGESRSSPITAKPRHTQRDAAGDMRAHGCRRFVFSSPPPSTDGERAALHEEMPSAAARTPTAGPSS
jgi:hypothetical protein